MSNELRGAISTNVELSGADSMTIRNQNFAVFEGEDKVIVIRVRTQRIGGIAANLTGATIIWYVATDPESNAALISKATGGSGITLSNYVGTNDQVNIALDAADTQSLEGRELYHECRITDVAGKESVITAGLFDVKPSSTS